MNQSITFSFLLLIGLSLGMACQDKEQEAAIFDPILLRQELQQIADQQELMGMAVLLIADGEILWQSNHGIANATTQVPIDKETLFRVASISKSITATAVMQLVEQSKLDIDKDVSNYLGWELKHPKHPNTPITLRLLLSHRSGIRDGSGYASFSRDMLVKQLNIKELLSPTGSYYSADMFDDTAPGDFFLYTNCTYGLIASIIEKASGERFDRYCRQHILEPLGMKGSFNLIHLKKLESVAAIYRFKEDAWKAQVDDYSNKPPASRAYEGYQLGQNGLIFGPQGSLRASTQDLAHFTIMLLNNGQWNNQQILKKSSVNLMLANHWTHDGQNGDTWDNFFLSYGFGMHRLTNTASSDIIFPDHTMMGHPGIAYGLLSDMYFDKDSKSGIIFITNGSKKEYAYGQKTTFYEVEEQVFETLSPIFQQLKAKH